MDLRSSILEDSTVVQLFLLRLKLIALTLLPFPSPTCPFQVHPPLECSPFAVVARIYFVQFPHLLSPCSFFFSNTSKFSSTSPTCPSQARPLQKYSPFNVLARICSPQFLSQPLFVPERIRRRNATQQYKINIRVDLLLPPPLSPFRTRLSTLTCTASA